MYLLWRSSSFLAFALQGVDDEDEKRKKWLRLDNYSVSSGYPGEQFISIEGNPDGWEGNADISPKSIGVDEQGKAIQASIMAKFY